MNSIRMCMRRLSLVLSMVLVFQLLVSANAMAEDYNPYSDGEDYNPYLEEIEEESDPFLELFAGGDYNPYIEEILEENNPFARRALGSGYSPVEPEGGLHIAPINPTRDAGGSTPGDPTPGDDPDPFENCLSKEVVGIDYSLAKPVITWKIKVDARDVSSLDEAALVDIIPGGLDLVSDPEISIDGAAKSSMSLIISPGAPDPSEYDNSKYDLKEDFDGDLDEIDFYLGASLCGHVAEIEYSTSIEVPDSSLTFDEYNLTTFKNLAQLYKTVSGNSISSNEVSAEAKYYKGGMRRNKITIKKVDLYDETYGIDGATLRFSSDSSDANIIDGGNPAASSISINTTVKADESAEEYVYYVERSADTSISSNDIKYTLKEIDAPALYKIADDITFTIDKDGKVKEADASGYYALPSGDVVQDGEDIVITMYDEPEGGVVPVYFAKMEAGATAGTRLKDAKLQVTGSNGFTTVSWTSTDQATTDKLIDLPYFADGRIAEYTFAETEAPSGYNKASSITVSVSANSAGEPIVSASSGMTSSGDGKSLIIMYDEKKSDEKIHILFNKIEADKKEPLSGAYLEIKGINTTAKASYTSTKTPKEYSFNAHGDGVRNYTFTELKAPSGYSIASPIEFRILTNDVVEVKEGTAWKSVSNNTITMIDERITEKEIYVKKLVKGAEKETPVAGATLKVTGGKAGTEIAPWVTSSVEAEVKHLVKVPYSATEDLEYKLTETVTPYNYYTAAPIDFKITKAGVLQIKEGDKWVASTTNEIVMYDEAKPIAKDIKIYKRAGSSTGKILADASLEVRCSGQLVSSWVTEKNTYEILSLPYDPNGDTTYVLTETSAPDGYEEADDIEFVIDKNGDLYVNGKKNTKRTITMVDKKEKSSGGGSGSGDTPQSGSSSSSSSSSSGGSSGGGSGTVVGGSGDKTVLPSYPGLPGGYVLPKNLTVADVLPLVPYFEALMKSDPDFYRKLPPAWQAVYNYMVAAGVLGAKHSPKTGELPYIPYAVFAGLVALYVYYYSDKKLRVLVKK